MISFVLSFTCLSRRRNLAERVRSTPTSAAPLPFSGKTKELPDDCEQLLSEGVSPVGLE